jgi:hypothetical protein
MIEESYMQYAIANKIEDYVRLYLKSIPNNQKEDTRIFIYSLLQTGIKFVLEEIKDHLTNIYEDTFNKLVEKDNIKIYPTLKDVIDTEIDLKIGDYVLFINDYGAIFGPNKVLGFCKPNDVNGCIYLNHDCYWYPTQVDKIVKL